MKIDVTNKVVTVTSENQTEGLTLFNLMMENKGTSFLKDRAELIINKRKFRGPWVGKHRKDCPRGCGRQFVNMKRHLSAKSCVQPIAIRRELLV